MSWKIEDNGFIKTWAQDVRNSYIIRLKYALIPKGVKTDVRFIDTPYRFQSYQEARAYAKELFPCYSYAIEGSADIPNFNESQFIQRTPASEIHKVKYYDLYGVKPSYIKNNNTALESRKIYKSNSDSNSKKSNKNSNIDINNKDIHLDEEINRRLKDIEVLRRKLDEKEQELKAFKKIN